MEERRLTQEWGPLAGHWRGIGATLVCANPKARGRLFRPQVGDGAGIKNIAPIADIRV